VCISTSKLTGVAFLDISTGEFMLAEGSFDYVDKLLSSFQPKEVLVERSHLKDFADQFGTRYYTYKLDDWMFTNEAAESRLLKHFQTVSLKGFGVQGLNAGIVAAGAILQYLDLTQHTRLDHISKISRIEQDQYVWLDKFTIRNLEIFQTLNEGARSLIDVLDRTITPMGSRTMKRWLSLPLRQISSIRERHAIVDFMVNHQEFVSLLSENLRLIGDLERLVSKVSAMRVSPRELLQLKTALKAVHPIKEACRETGLEPLVNLGENLQPCHAVIRKIEQHIADDAPALVTKGGVIAKGVSAELDELRNILHSGRDFLLQIQQREAARTGIPSLKVSYNNVFGYFIEVRNTHKDKVLLTGSGSRRW
jgi:DNA mismatch repair protein MutS